MRSHVVIAMRIADSREGGDATKSFPEPRNLVKCKAHVAKLVSIRGCAMRYAAACERQSIGFSSPRSEKSVSISQAAAHRTRRRRSSKVKAHSKGDPQNAEPPAVSLYSAKASFEVRCAAHWNIWDLTNDLGEFGFCGNKSL